MQQAVAPGAGAMSALIGTTVAEAQEICAAAADDEVVSSANINAPGQIVVSGTKAAVGRSARIAISRGFPRSVPLPVSCPTSCRRC